ncbi:MAG: AtpZ/AtpI family protein [Ignavibacteria bacterium]|nr:AtpZ/AtpI family protein [Bacteroidota bacterium]MSQ46630.1 AtpZ/AtpI family protein [Ignavibacteria bacterium]
MVAVLNENKQNNLNQNLRENSALLTAGFQLAAGVLIFFFIGYWLDGKFNTTPWLTVLLSMIGASASVYKFIRTALSVSEKTDKINR